MLTIEQMRARLAEAQTEARGIHTEAGEAALTPEAEARFLALDTEVRELEAKIVEAEARAAEQTRVAELRARYNSVQVAPTRRDPFDLAELRGMPLEDAEVRAVDMAHAVFEDRRNTRRVEARHVEALLDTIDRVPGAALHALVHGSDAYRAAFAESMQAALSGRAPILTGAQAEAMRAAMSLTSANGGYVLPTLLDPSLIPTWTVYNNPIRGIARVETITQNVWNGITAGAVTSYWTPEATAVTDGSPTFGSAGVTAAKLTTYVTGSYEIFEDSNLYGQLPGMIADSQATAEGIAFISGSGSGAPRGIVTAISGTTASRVTATTRGSYTSASAVDTRALFNALPSRFEDSSTWLMHKLTWLTANQQTEGTTGYRLVDLEQKGRLLDLPVVRASSMASATTSGTVLAVLGDFKRFLIVDRIGMSLEAIPNVVDGSGIPTGQRGIVAHRRVGSDVLDVNAFRFLLT